MRLAVLSALCFVSSCFTEPSADRMWRCSVDQPLCPEGQTCISDWCVKDGTAMPDMSVSDATVADMFKSPCSDGLPIGTQGVWGCRGKFGPATTKASALCLNGYKLCADGYKVTDAECTSATLIGSFSAEAPATGSNGLLAKCATTTGMGWGSYWFGCGWAVTGVSGPKGERTANPCRNLSLVAFCDNPNLLFCDLNDGRLDAQKNDEPRNGVLCCPP